MEPSDPRLLTHQLEQVVAAWRELGLPRPTAQELFAMGILRLRSGEVEWTDKEPTESGWYWFARKPDPGNMYRHLANPGVRLVEARRVNGDTKSLYIEGDRFLYEDDVKGARWSKVTIPTSPFEVMNGPT